MLSKVKPAAAILAMQFLAGPGNAGDPSPPPPAPPWLFTQGEAAMTLSRATYFKEVTKANGFHYSYLWDYGNWCGKGGDGRAFDAYDRCCYFHDQCYDMSGVGVSDTRSPAGDVCDDDAVRCWMDARKGRPARFGGPGLATWEATWAGQREDPFLYPCYDCSDEDTMTSSSTRYRCNRDCAPNMFLMKINEFCNQSFAQCASGSCKKSGTAYRCKAD